jgi:opacity protein-like surface antigen
LCGLFPLEQFEIEPEFMLVKPESVTPTYLFNGNLAYNFKLSSGSASPFILAGYDITNCSPGVGVLIVNYDTTIGVLNLGGGLKILVAKNVAVRVEYRYQKFTTEKSLSIYGFSSAASVDINNHTMNVGFSVILQPSSLLLE